MLVEGEPALWQWEINDDAPPNTSFVEFPPNEIPLDIPVGYTVSSNELDADFECALDPINPDAPEYSGCATADNRFIDLGTPEAGEHTLYVRAIDPSLNVDPTPAIDVFTVVGPAVTTFTEGPVGAPLPLEGATTPHRTATFAWESNQSGPITYMCSLDGAEFTPCDVADRRSPASSAPATRSRCSPRTGSGSSRSRPPRTSGRSPCRRARSSRTPRSAQAPLDGATSATVRFTFTSDIPGSTFQCKLDNGPVTPCASGVTYHNLADTNFRPPHVFQVFAVSPAGIEDSTPEIWEFGIDYAPETFIESFPPNPSSSTFATFGFGSNDPNATFECALDTIALSSCANPELFEGLLPGVHELYAAAKDAAGNVDPTPEVYRWTVGPPPGVAFTRTPPEQSTENTATFEFTSDVPGNVGVTFECAFGEAIEAEIWAPCTSPKTFTNLVFGEHEFAVRAKDAAGNVSEFPAEWGWEVGGFAPTVMITSEPWVNDERRTATFEFQANGSNLIFTCSIDGSEMSPCPTTESGATVTKGRKTYSGLALGPHEFEVQVYAPLALEEPLITSYAWNVVELTAPKTTISFGPPAIVGTEEGGSLEATVGFFFSGNEPLATFECALDGELFSDCDSPAQFDATIGEHLFRVRAVDVALNIDATPASWEFTVVEAPDTFIDMGPEGEFNTGRATFHFSSTLAGSTFECAIDMGQFFACDNPHVVTGLPDGEHTFEVRAVKQHGTVKVVDTTPELWEWTVENQLPDTEIVSGPATANPTTSFGGTFRFSSPDPTVGEFECALDGGLFDDCSADPAPDPDRGLAHPRGARRARPAHAARARARRRRPLRPDARVLHVARGPGAGDEHHGRPADRDERDDREDRVRLADRRQLRVLARQRGLRGLHRRPRTVTGLSVGWHSFSVRAIDSHGFVDQTPASTSWTVTHPAETTPPVTTILSGPAPAPGGSTASTVATFRFEASELGTTWDCSLDGSAYSFCMPGKTYNDLALGEHVFRLYATDAAGNVEATPVEYRWTVIDGATTPPETFITRAPAAVSTTDNATFEFGSTQEGSTYQCSIDLKAFETCTSPKTYTAIPPGEHIFYVRATNEQGATDQSPAFYEWTSEDVTPPSTELLVTPTDPSGSANARFEFTGTDNALVVEGEVVPLTFECNLDNQGWQECFSPKIYTGLTAGFHTFQVRALDDAGNFDPTPAGYSWEILDGTPPETNIDDGPDTPTTETTATLEFSSPTAGATFECALDAAAFDTCESPLELHRRRRRRPRLPRPRQEPGRPRRRHARSCTRGRSRSRRTRRRPRR